MFEVTFEDQTAESPRKAPNQGANSAPRLSQRDRNSAILKEVGIAENPVLRDYLSGDIDLRRAARPKAGGLFLGALDPFGRPTGAGTLITVDGKIVVSKKFHDGIAVEWSTLIFPLKELRYSLKPQISPNDTSRSVELAIGSYTGRLDEKFRPVGQGITRMLAIVVNERPLAPIRVVTTDFESGPYRAGELSGQGHRYSTYRVYKDGWSFSSDPYANESTTNLTGWFEAGKVVSGLRNSIASYVNQPKPIVVNLIHDGSYLVTSTGVELLNGNGKRLEFYDDKLMSEERGIFRAGSLSDGEYLEMKTRIWKKYKDPSVSMQR